MVYCPDDTAAPLADFGVDILADGASEPVKGWLRRSVTVAKELGVELPLNSYVLTVEADSLGALCTDQRLKVGDTWYRYREPVEGAQDRFDYLVVVKATS